MEREPYQHHMPTGLDGNILSGAEHTRRVLLPLASAMTSLASDPTAVATLTQAVHTDNRELLAEACRSAGHGLNVEVLPKQAGSTEMSVKVSVTGSHTTTAHGDTWSVTISFSK